VALAQGLAPDALTGAAALYGLGVEGAQGVAGGLGVPAYAGSVPPQPGALPRAAAAIGQGTVLASPLAMASVAATVADGTYRRPSLVTGDAAPAPVPPRPLDAGVARSLRELMRGVVTEGSAQVLADLPGAPVIAKTGTAEYGTDVPPRTHAWIVAAQGDLAVAVLLEDGGSGGRDAGPVARDLLARLG
jgi:cell division protein FtsI/penicillin-binding protein 2